MELSREEVRKVALLARLELTEEELDSQAQHINSLLSHFEILQRLDVSGVEPTSHVIPMVNVFREDVMRPSLTREETLGNAPEAREGHFIVPRIVEGV
jgi:aspartyl-tRNA(Asn)/glutamyl-tRNA(Gln) amidotransferase subunit C